jgi:hypothetical protein
MMPAVNEFDPAEEEVQRRLLEGALWRIRQGGHPLLRDIAESLLKGELTFQELSTSSAAAPVLQAAATRYLEWKKELTPEQHEALVGQISTRVGQMRQDILADNGLQHG